MTRISTVIKMPPFFSSFIVTPPRESKDLNKQKIIELKLQFSKMVKDVKEAREVGEALATQKEHSEATKLLSELIEEIQMKRIIREIRRTKSKKLRVSLPKMNVHNWIVKVPVIDVAVRHTRNVVRYEPPKCELCNVELIVNSEGLLVCPNCGTVYGRQMVSIPETLRPIAPGFDIEHPHIRAVFKTDVPKPLIYDTLATFVKLIGHMRNVKNEITSNIKFTDGDPFEKMISNLSKAVENNFWKVLTKGISPLLMTDKECTISAASVFGLATINNVFDDMNSLSEDEIIYVIKSLYDVITNMKTVHVLLPFSAVKLKSKISSHEITYIYKTKGIIPIMYSCDVKPDMHHFVTQLLILLYVYNKISFNKIKKIVETLSSDNHIDIKEIVIATIKAYEAVRAYNRKRAYKYRLEIQNV